MSLKSTFTVDVDDSRFREFQERWDNYRATLTEASGPWAEMAKGNVEAAAALEKMVAKERDLNAVARLTALAKGRALEMDKEQAAAKARADYAALSRMEKLGKGAKDYATRMTGALTHWKGVTGQAKETEARVASVTRLMSGWKALSVIGGLGGLGGSLYGLDRLAQGAAAARRQSLGTGTPYGNQRAFSLNYSPYTDGDAMMGAIGRAKSDPTSQEYLGLISAGITEQEIRKKNAADLGVEFFEKLPKLFPKGADDPKLGAKYGPLQLESILPQEDAKRFLGINDDERRQRHKDYVNDSKSMAADPAMLRKWADLDIALGRAKDNIETALVRGLAPLAPQFTDLSGSVANIITDFAKSPEVKADLESLASGLDTFDKALKNPDSWWNKAGSALNGFAKAEKDAGDATHKALIASMQAHGLGFLTYDYWFGSGGAATGDARRQLAWMGRANGLHGDRLKAFVTGGDRAHDPGDAVQGKVGAGDTAGSPGGASLSDRARGRLGAGYTGRGAIGRVSAATLANGDESLAFWKSKGLSAEAAAGLVGMEQGEALYDPADKTGDSGNAHGSFQWHADRRANIRTATGIDIDTATHAQQLEAAYWEMTQSNDAGARKAWEIVNRRGITAGQAAAAGTTFFERPADKPGQSLIRGKMAQGWLDRANGRERAAAPPSAITGTMGAPATGPTIGDKAAMDARRRLAEGRGSDADRDLTRRYREQQNTPALAKGTVSASHPDDDRASRARATSPSAWHQSPLQFTPGGGANALTDLYGNGFGDKMHRDAVKHAAGLDHDEVRAAVRAHLGREPGTKQRGAEAMEPSIHHKIHDVLLGMAGKSGRLDGRDLQRPGGVQRIDIRNSTGNDIHTSAIGAAFG